MEKERKRRRILKYSFLSLSLISYGFIIYQSAIVGETSSRWSGWASDIWIDLLNVKLNLKENIDEVKPETISLSNNSYIYNSVSGYEDNEIPLGCVKQLKAEVLPIKTTDRSVTFEAIPSNMVNLVASGNVLTIEALKKGNVTISAKSNADNSLIQSFNYSIVDLVKPASFDVKKESITLKNGQSSLIDVQMNETVLGDNQVKLSRYYDISKLTYSSSNPSVAEVVGQYVKAKSEGSATITVTNGTVTKNIDVIVENNSSPILNVTGKFDVNGSSDVHILDVDYDLFTQLSVDWGSNDPTDKNVIWSVDKPLAAIVNQKGEVRGYRNIDPKNDVDFKVTATSVDNPSIKQDFNMKLRHVLPTSIDVSTSLKQNDEGFYMIPLEKTSSMNIVFNPKNTTLKDYDVICSDSSYVQITKSGNSINFIGLKKGTTTIQIVSKNDESVKSEIIKLDIDKREIINDDNHERFVYIVRKYLGGHAFLFAMFGIFTTLYIYFAHIEKKSKILLVAVLCSLLVGFLLSGVSEIVQLYTPGRIGSFSDVGIDMMGYGLGFVFISIVLSIIWKVKQRKTSYNKLEKEWYA